MKRIMVTRNSKNGYGGKMIYIGRYFSEEEAALAYNRKATELWGEFARINEVPCATQN